MTKERKLHIETAEKMTRLMGYTGKQALAGKTALELCEKNWSATSLKGFVASMFPSGDDLTVLTVITLDEDGENEETIAVMVKLKDITKEELFEKHGVGTASRVYLSGVLRLGDVYKAGKKSSSPGELRCAIRMVESNKVQRHFYLDETASQAKTRGTQLGRPIPSAQENRNAREDFAKDASTTFRSKHEVVGLAVSKEELDALAEAAMPQPFDDESLPN
jgi:hypothetical protein